jgi:23S rRNA (cytosine1962-C5)-methyltransferase
VPEPELVFLTSPDWKDYELLDSGGGFKLERFGPYRFVRPEHQAVWQRKLSPAQWEAADGVFQATQEESGGHWLFRKSALPAWRMRYKSLVFEATAGNSRHLGVFPEQANHWDWVSDLIQEAQRPVRAAQSPVRAAQSPVRVLNLFGYTGIATLAAAQAGATVTHVDAAKKSVQWARQNQALSGLEARPIRWLVDDAEKFVQREVRRGSEYDGVLLDPPKFGRGPEGQVWEFFDSLPGLLEDCRRLFSSRPLFVALTAYAIRASALSVHYALEEMVSGLGGRITSGELALLEKSGGRYLPCAIFARWQADE